MRLYDLLLRVPPVIVTSQNTTVITATHATTIYYYYKFRENKFGFCKGTHRYLNQRSVSIIYWDFITLIEIHFVIAKSKCKISEFLLKSIINLTPKILKNQSDIIPFFFCIFSAFIISAFFGCEIIR